MFKSLNRLTKVPPWTKGSLAHPHGRRLQVILTQ